MSSSREAAARYSWRVVPETCPAVNDALAEAGRLIKEQTGALREALIDAIERAEGAEEIIEELRAEIARLQDELAQVNA